MKLRNILALGLSGLILTAVLAGCGAAPASTPGAAPAPGGSGAGTTDPVNIVWGRLVRRGGGLSRFSSE